MEQGQLENAIITASLKVHNYLNSTGVLKGLFEQLQITIRRNEQRNHINPLVRKGAKFFSQNDEDGILLEIVRRCGIEGGTFVEFGVGDGLENNTLILLMSGWRGHWFGGETLAFNSEKTPRWGFEKTFITAENVVQLYRIALDHFMVDDIDAYSIDLDGNDIHITEKLFEAGYRPKICICEYNAKFPPPIEFRLRYDPAFMWDGSTDYTAASIQSYANVMNRYGYQLAACNISGSNAFFVRDDYMGEFQDIPRNIADLYAPPNDGVLYTLNHKPSPRTILSFITGENNA